MIIKLVKYRVSTSSYIQVRLKKKLGGFSGETLTGVKKGELCYGRLSWIEELVRIANNGLCFFYFYFYFLFWGLGLGIEWYHMSLSQIGHCHISHNHKRKQWKISKEMMSLQHVWHIDLMDNIWSLVSQIKDLIVGQWKEPCIGLTQENLIENSV